jgi:hypothetical protein
MSAHQIHFALFIYLLGVLFDWATTRIGLTLGISELNPYAFLIPGYVVTLALILLIDLWIERYLQTNGKAPVVLYLVSSLVWLAVLNNLVRINEVMRN